MTLIGDLKNACKNFSGNVLTIGLDFPTVDQVLEKNNMIKNNYVMNFNGKKRGKKQEKGGRGKNVSIKKLKRIFKKKRIDYIICNIEDINRFLRTFIRDSVYINKNKLYIYGYKNKMDVELLEKRYRRYNTNIEIIEYEKEILMIIDNSSSKNNIFKDFIYNISDLGYSLVNLIGDILIS